MAQSNFSGNFVAIDSQTGIVRARLSLTITLSLSLMKGRGVAQSSLGKGEISDSERRRADDLPSVTAEKLRNLRINRRRTRRGALQSY